jgi:nucleoside-diphosphate-sugar epimerase
MELTQFGDVFHLAAVVGGRTKIERDPIAVAQDLAIDAAFFSWAVRTKPQRLLYASSSAAYPIKLQTFGSLVPLREDFISFEDAVGLPDMTYGWAKLTGEYLARIAARTYGLHVACVRPFSGYGEDQDASYPVPAIARRAARHEDPLHVWGSGNQSRDFVYIDDCIEAMLRAIEQISDGSGVNIGTGTPTTFRQIAEILSRIAGYSPHIQPLEDRPAGVSIRCADPTLARTLLGWEPKVALEEGLERVYRFAVDGLNQKHLRSPYLR